MAPRKQTLLQYVQSIQEGLQTKWRCSCPNLLESLTWLLDNQQKDGGFPAEGIGSRSAAWCTSDLLFLNAILRSKLLNKGHAARALRFVRNLQLADGGWPEASRSASIVDITARILRTLCQYDPSLGTREQIARGVAFLLNEQSMGGWGHRRGNRNNPYSTYLVAEALITAREYVNRKLQSSVDDAEIQATRFFLTTQVNESDECGWSNGLSQKCDVSSTVSALHSLLLLRPYWSSALPTVGLSTEGDLLDRIGKSEVWLRGKTNDGEWDVAMTPNVVVSGECGDVNFSIIMHGASNFLNYLSVCENCGQWRQEAVRTLEFLTKAQKRSSYHKMWKDSANVWLTAEVCSSIALLAQRVLGVRPGVEPFKTCFVSLGRRRRAQAALNQSLEPVFATDDSGMVPSISPDNSIVNVASRIENMCQQIHVTRADKDQVRKCPGEVRLLPENIIDVLIVTSVKEEADAVCDVSTGSLRGTKWKPLPSPTKLELFVRTFEAQGGALRFAVTRAFGMGREQAVMAAGPLLAKLPEIRCLAMCGVCAGRRGDVNLGDVIIADRAWPYDAGKLKALYQDGERSEQFEGDMELYRIHPPSWKQCAERFGVDPNASWIAMRPRSYENQGEWLLERLAKGDDPYSHCDRESRCPDYAAVLKQLWKVKWLEDGALNLTTLGKEHIRRLLVLHPCGLPAAIAPFKIHVGPIGSGAPVVEDPEIFNRFVDSAAMRKVLGAEMETSAVLALAYLLAIPHAVVMKGVMDHADPFKSDNMKPFAARASAECLIAFIRQHLAVQ